MDRSTELHEAAHASAAIWFGGRPVHCVRVDYPDVRVAGRVTSTLERDLGPEDVAIHLIGWMAGGDHPNWPPPWPIAEDELEDIRWLIRILDLNEEQYEGCIALAEKLLADESFRRLMHLVAGALRVAPVIDRESVEVLTTAAGIPAPPPEGAAA